MWARLLPLLMVVVVPVYWARQAGASRKGERVARGGHSLAPVIDYPRCAVHETPRCGRTHHWLKKGIHPPALGFDHADEGGHLGPELAEAGQATRLKHSPALCSLFLPTEPRAVHIKRDRFKEGNYTYNTMRRGIRA